MAKANKGWRNKTDKIIKNNLRISIVESFSKFINSHGKKLTNINEPIFINNQTKLVSNDNDLKIISTCIGLVMLIPKIMSPPLIKPNIYFSFLSLQL